MRRLADFALCAGLIFATSGCISARDSYIGHYRVEVVGQSNVEAQQRVVRQIALEIANKLGRKIDFEIIDQKQIQIIMKAGEMHSQPSIVLTSRWMSESKSEFGIDFAKQGRAEDEILRQTKSAIESVLDGQSTMKWQFGETSWSYAK